MKDRDKAYKLCRDSNNPVLKQNFKRLRSAVSNKLDTAKNQYISGLLSDPSPGKRWRHLRSLGTLKKPLPPAVSHFSMTSLNAHFSSVTNRHPPLTPPDLPVILNTPAPVSDITPFSFTPVTDAQVLSVINSTYTNSTGPDHISKSMLKLSAPSILPHLTALINSSFSSATFPSSWKNSHIRPLLKTITPNSPSDTRPIALLPEMAKIQERLAFDQLLAHLESNNLFTPRQACYRKGHSTQTALLGVLDDIREAIENRRITFLMLFDFSKAFDCIPHKRLLQKLRRYHISDNVIKWLFSYLYGRHQTVTDDKGNSGPWNRVSSGVPQGSVLGPLLFALYINDLPESLSFSNFMIYADDTQIYLHCLPSHIRQGIANIQSDAQSVANWALLNGLELNLKKTKVMVIGSSSYITSIDFASLPLITVNNTAIEYVHLFKNLGVHITSTLNWKPQVDHILKKVYSSLGSLKFYRTSLSTSLRIQLTKSLILPHFDYASIVFIDLDKTRTLELQTAHNSCIRFIFGNIPFIPTNHVNTHLTHKRLQLGWLSLASRRHFQLACLIYKTISNTVPKYLNDRLKLRPFSALTARSVRLPPRIFDYHSARTEAWKSSFSLLGRSLLNSLAVTSFSHERITEFKKWLYPILLKLEIDEWSVRVARDNLTPPNVGSLLPYPPLPLNESAFTFTNQHQNTEGYHLCLTFITPICNHVRLRSHL